MTKVIIYTTNNCPFCVMAKEVLKSRNIEFTEIRVDTSPEKREEMMRLSQRRTVPQIFFGDDHIGGYDDLTDLIRSGGINKYQF